MLKNEISDNTSLTDQKQKVYQLLPAELKKYFETDDHITPIEYPVLEYPLKLNSLSFDKQPLISGILKGIKGQYLIFDQGNVLNIRKHNGYWIQLKY